MKRLSPRQAEILLLRRAGFTERQVADALGMRPRTVQAYSHHLCAAGWMPGRMSRRNSMRESEFIASRLHEH